MKNRAALLVLFLYHPAVNFSQDAGRLRTFFNQNIGLDSSEIDRIEHGQPVAKILESPKASQVFVFGAVVINGQPDSYIRSASSFDWLRSLPGYLAIQRFSDPPTLSDLSGFAMESADLDEL